MPYYKKPYSAKKKFGAKWYVDGSFPSVNTPLGKIGGGGIRFGNGTGKIGAKSLTSIIKTKARMDEPIKYKVVPSTATPMIATGVYTLNPLGNIPIGTGDLSRLTSDIFVRGVRLRGVFTGPENVGTGTAINCIDRPVHIRLMWLRSNVATLQSTDAFSISGLSVTDIFRAGTTHPYSGIPDPDKVTMLSDTVITVPGSTIPGVKQTKSFEYDLPLANFPFKFNSNTSNYSSINKNLYCVVIPFAVGDTPGGTVDTTAIYGWNCVFSDSR